MAISDDFTARPAHPARVRSFGSEIFHTIGLALSALAAGRRAAADYERLSSRSDRQLREAGLSRDRLPQVIERRHFATMGRSTDR